MARNENSGLVRNLKVNYDDRNGTFSLEKFFPDDFFIEFSQFEKNYNIKFIKLNPFHSTYPIKSSDIYVIDKKTNQPVTFQADSEEV